MKRLTCILLSFFPFIVASCLFENDMSYPRVAADIVEFEVENSKSITIDAANKRIDVVLDEYADMSAVKVLSMKCSSTASFKERIPEYMDLTGPVKILLNAYYDYEWTVYATQPIERYIKVANQVGEASISKEKHYAEVFVTENTSLREIVFEEMKLEPELSVVKSTTGTIMTSEGVVDETVSCNFPMSLECVNVRKFQVEYRGNIIDWSVKVLQKKVENVVSFLNARCYHVDIQGSFDGTGNPVIQYRKASESEWKTVPSSDTEITGVRISCRVDGLEAGTEYLVRIVNGDAAGAEAHFVTETPEQVMNMSFDDWWQSGKTWYPYLETTPESERSWDSANMALTQFNMDPSTTPEESDVIKGKAVRMESKYAVIAFAAGNIYTGEFGKVNGLGAILDWGVPFKSRPVSLKGHYKYSPKVIDKVKAPYESKKGEMDKCQIQILLTDWETPFTINTTTSHFVNIDKDPNIIAYGKLESEEETIGWKNFEIELEYRDLSRKPNFIVITCCASYLGDYFTGGVGSLLYVDEFELVYD